MTVRPIEQWPGELTRDRKASNFSTAWTSTVELLGRELRAIGGTDIVLQVAMTENDFRIDGYPRAQAKPEHPGVILSLGSKAGPLSWPCDTFTTWQDNIRGIALSMEALRKMERYGVTKRGEQYTGWKALPQQGSEASEFGSAEAAIAFLRTVATATPPNANLTALYRRARASTHTDRPGNDRAQWDRVEAAGEILRAAKLIE